MERIQEIPKPPWRPDDAHKGTAGTVLVVAGSRGMAGSASLVGNAALRSGAGLVKIATPDAVLDTVAGLAPCCTSAPLPDAGGVVKADAASKIAELAENHDALAAGPGLGRSSGVTSVIRAVLLRVKLPIVLDADGLNALEGKAAQAFARADGPLIITPHPGEAARLLGREIREIQSDREASAARLVKLGADVAVLKGAGTVVTDGKRLYVNETGNPGMATAGAGDVLTGLLAALVAAGMDPFDAAVLGVHVHGRAGDLAAEQRGTLGTIATDILDCLPQALRL